MIEYFPATTRISVEATQEYFMEYFPVLTGSDYEAKRGYYMNMEYFPVEFTESQYLINKYRIAWYTKDSIIHHPKVLVSYAHRPDKPLREIFNDDGVKILGDSGGFQAVTLNMNIDPNDVIKWQNENCDIGITLDRPPLRDLINVSPEAWYKGAEFEKYMKISNDNANLMMSKKNQNLKLYLALHGYDEATRKQWLIDGLKQYQNWDGYAIASKPNDDMKNLADWLIFAKNNNLKNIHLLAISGATTLPIAAYMSRYFDSIFFDSSSYSMGSRQRIYYLPFTVRGKLSMASMKENNNGIPKTLPCDCQVCSKIKDTSIFSSTENMGFAGWLVNIHNIVQTQRYITLLAGTIHDREVFGKIVGRRVMEVINYIDDKLSGKGQITF